MAADVSEVVFEMTLETPEPDSVEQVIIHLAGLSQRGSQDSVYENRHFATSFAPARVRRIHAREVEM
jgi:hypothetical protein